jgi:hypothetical protein
MKYDGAKPIRLSKHAQDQCKERGTHEAEITTAIASAVWIPARENKFECKYSFQYNADWGGRYYAIKEVKPIFVEEMNEIVVVTVITYYN